jgi:hypothetical protein
MVTVPNIVPLTPHLRKNPVFIYTYDHFSEPTPFKPDIVVSIDDTIQKKLDMYNCHVSQVYEWLPYNMNILDQVPKDPKDRKAWLAKMWGPRSAEPADEYRDLLIKLYGKEKGSKVKYAEAFEVSEYGRQPSLEELKQLFPFFN